MATTATKPKRLYLIQDDQGDIINALSDIGNLDVAIIVTKPIDDQGNIGASVQRAFIQKKTTKKEVDELQAMIEKNEE